MNARFFPLRNWCANFPCERVNKAAAIFDLKKLNWLNKEHINADASVESIAQK